MENRAELEQQLEGATETRQEFRDLLKSPAWAKLVEYFKVQGELRMQDLLSPAEGFDGMLRKEVMVGERNILLMFPRFPDLLIEGLDSEIKELQQTLSPDDVEN